MATAKLSLTLDDDLVKEARQRVGPRGLSGYVNQALEQRLQHDRIRSLLSDLDEEYGPVPTEVMEEVRESWLGPDGGSS